MLEFNHLRDINLSYYDHLLVALDYAKDALNASLIFTFHALFPDIFVTTGSEIIDKLNNKIKNNSIKKY